VQITKRIVLQNIRDRKQATEVLLFLGTSKKWFRLDDAHEWTDGIYKI
jgi:hypothetical protein